MPYYSKQEAQMEWEPMPIDAPVKQRPLVAPFKWLPQDHPVMQILTAAGMGCRFIEAGGTAYDL